MDNNSLAHTRWNCKYHIVFAPKYRRQVIYGIFKRESSLMIFDKFADLKYRYGNRKFWCRGYYVDTIGRNKKVIEEYIRNQLQEDYIDDPMSIKEYVDPFTGQPITEGK